MRIWCGLFLLLMLGAANGRVVTCKIRPTDFGPSSISWNDASMTASIYNPIYGTLTGRVSRLMSNPGGGKLVNLSFTAIPPDWKHSEWEFVVHRAVQGFYVEGVAYVTIKGVRYFDSILIDRDAVCDIK